ncbi:MAG: hypothetical protein CL496_01290 [Actinobacteria bacterium]|jgi:uncharacterized membrane protein YqgA involved in biofilm formation|nr:hypothetical protein [Actinomycetota bacterium]|tara:strand:+ start:1569 stop:2252 length:684 start_codon:yes stop_codon:yes gene_type:complete
MIPGIGTLINAFSVMGIGILGRIFIKKEIKNFENNLLPLGLLVLTLGIRESLKSPDFILTLLAVLVGSIIGTYLKIEEKIEKLGEYLHNKFEKNSSGKGRFIESYLTASLIVITGPLAIVGPFLDVVEGNIELLLIKTALDCFLVIFLISSGGRGAAYSGISILIYQGFFTLLAFGFGGSISAAVSDAVAGVGGVLLVGVGINLLGIKKIPVGNYILSLFIPFLVAF